MSDRIGRILSRRTNSNVLARTEVKVIPLYFFGTSARIELKVLQVQFLTRGPLYRRWRGIS